MNFGLHELLSSCAAIIALPLFFCAPGYAAASVTDLMGFRGRGWIERLLWATALSVPLALLLAVHPGVPLAPRLTTAGFLVLAVGAAIFAFRDWRSGATPPTHWDHSATLGAWSAAALIPYVLFTTIPFSWRGRLYESSLWQDWNVRIQLVNAAIRGGNHPGNPMFAVAGQPAPLHYYYYWYVLCARLHDVVPVDARSLLVASCVGSAFALLAFALLAVKYLGPQASSYRRQGVAALLVSCLLGLDLVSFCVALFFHRSYSDLQFWLDDRSPGWLGMIVWSPHHVAGLVCCGLGTLLFIQTLHLPEKQRWVHTVLAAICFGASAGTSTFITLLFGVACFVLFLDALVRRQWVVLRCMICATVLAVLLVAPFAYRLLHTPAGSAMDTQYLAARQGQLAPPPAFGAAHLFQFSMRYKPQAAHLSASLLRRQAEKRGDSFSLAGLTKTQRWEGRLLRPPMLLLYFVAEFGFFLFVFASQVRTDFLSGVPMERQARVLWLLFGSLAVPAFLVSSGGLQSNNDFGRHAGFCLRLILLLWATPMVARFLAQWRLARQEHRSLPVRGAVRWAVAFAVIGLLGQVAQTLLLRLRFGMTHAGWLPHVVVEERIPNAPFRFGQLETALAAATADTPPDGIVQGNPDSRLQNVLLLYANRQMAADDDGCNIPFGGDAKACVPMARKLTELFGGQVPHYQGQQGIFRFNPVGYDAAAATPASFQQACSAFKLTTVIASYVDPAWWHPDSWVWQLQPLYSNRTARVFRCSAAEPSGSAQAAPPPVVH